MLIGADDGVAPIVDIAQQLRDRRDAQWQPLVLLSLDPPAAFRPRPSTILIPGMPEGAIACHPTLDDLGIASRLASSAGYPGCFDGDVAELAASWLRSLDASALGEIEILACGSAATLAAVAAVAQQFELPLQLNRS